MIKKGKVAGVVRAALMASAAASLAFSSQVWAAEEEDDEAKEDADKIVITGSRLQRQTYSSISPIQVITTEEAKQEGLVDAGSIVQFATASAGQQIDLTFTGFVLDNGPGASTADLRGLGANRTLNMINGRRLAPIGVEGAPSAPDLNMLPAGLIQQFEFVLDGASSLYGSDAVAGVNNAILRKDFDGFEFDATYLSPEHGGGETARLTGTWGKSYDRGFIGVGVEYFDAAEVKLSQRPWTNQCDRHAEITDTGEVRTLDLFYPETFGQRVDPRGCKPTQRLVGRVSVPLAGSIYYTPGFSNGGWGNFSESSQFGLGIDSDGDGIADVSFVDYTLNGAPENQARSLYGEQDRLSFMAYGEYTLEGAGNITPYFETMYGERDFFTTSGQPQLFPNVQADNPYNICNPNGLNGVDCGLAWDGLMNNPAFVADVMAAFGCDPSSGGSCDQTVGALGPQSVLPIVAVRGDRNNVTTTYEQFRQVLGFTADLPWNVSGVPDWTVDVYGSYTKNVGTSSRFGIRGDRLNQALDAEVVNGEVVCRDTSNGCVAVNLFSPTLYDPLIGDFATQAERDFLFDNRDFETTIEQKLFSTFFNGSLASWDAGDVLAGFGVEYRVDEIDSIPGGVADVNNPAEFFGFFNDGGAKGDRWVREYFAEVEVPLVANQPGAKELTLNLSGRYTKDEFYPSANTESIKMAWRPVDSLLIRGTYGTSYRAPNLRELFLRGSTGFLGLSDPCGIPESAIDPLNGYDPALDNREPSTISNCQQQGVDPFDVDRTSTAQSTEIFEGGSRDLKEERSTSSTYGFSWEQPFTNAFDFTIGATWYDIEIRNTIVNPSAQAIINECYTRPDGPGARCSRITRESGSQDIILVDQSVVNRDAERAKGVDVNIDWRSTIDTFGTPVRWFFSANATHPQERSFTEINEVNDTQTYDDFVGDFGYPTWQASSRLGAEFGSWLIVLNTRYLNDVSQRSDFVDPFSDIYDSQGTGFEGDTCEGPDFGDALCRDIGYAGDYMMHSIYARYAADTWTMGVGVRNLFDEAPPFVDGNEITAVNNAPIGSGYDLNGRVVFVDFSIRL